MTATATNPRSSTADQRGYPRIVTPPPGPAARAIVAQDEAWTSPSYIKEYPLAIAGGSGAMAEDVDGNRYIDFMAGIAVTSTGYNHPAVVQAIRDAAGRFLHICGTDFYFDGFARLAERLGRSAPGPGRKRVFLSNSGTEAVEGAIKLARYHTRRPALIGFHGSFHGRTYGAMSLTSSKATQRSHFGPLLPEVYHVEYPIRTGPAATGRRRCAHPSAASGSCSSGSSIRRMSPPSSSSRSRERAATSSPRWDFSRRSGRSATATGFCWWPTRCRAAWVAPVRCGPATGSSWSLTS
jgi:4-aminobutyrate aminotransferase-like enzyme